MLETLEEIFKTVVNYGILVVETVGVVVLLVAVVRAIVSLFHDAKHSKHLMAEGIATALSFLLGGELLKTVVAPDWHDIGMTCAILLMRAAMSVLLYWEGRHEE